MINVKRYIIVRENLYWLWNYAADMECILFIHYIITLLY